MGECACLVGYRDAIKRNILAKQFLGGHWQVSVTESVAFMESLLSEAEKAGHAPDCELARVSS